MAPKKNWFVTDRQRMQFLRDMRFFRVILLLLLVALGIHCTTSMPEWTTRAKGWMEVGDSCKGALLTAAGEIMGSSASVQGDAKKEQLVPCLLGKPPPGSPGSSGGGDSNGELFHFRSRSVGLRSNGRSRGKRCFLSCNWVCAEASANTSCYLHPFS